MPLKSPRFTVYNVIHFIVLALHAIPKNLFQCAHAKIWSDKSFEHFCFDQLPLEKLYQIEATRACCGNASLYCYILAYILAVVAMGRGKHLSAELRALAVELSEKGAKQTQISATLECSRRTVQTALRLAKEGGLLEDGKRTGRPRKSTIKEDRRIRRLSEADRRKTAPAIKQEFEASSDVVMSQRSYQRRLVEFGLHGRVARKKPYISEKNRVRRLSWAKRHANWTSQDWQKVVWSDESRFKKCGSDGKLYIRRRIGEEFNPKCTQGTVKHGGGGIMVWGAFRRSGVGPLVKIEGTMDAPMYVDILKQHLVDGYSNSLPLPWMFQQDNDPKHTSKLARQFFTANAIDVMDWPAQSPDLNPIENL